MGERFSSSKNRLANNRKGSVHSNCNMGGKVTWVLAGLSSCPEGVVEGDKEKGIQKNNSILCLWSRPCQLRLLMDAQCRRSSSSGVKYWQRQPEETILLVLTN